MLKIILFFFLTFNLWALEITFSGAKENFQAYSTLHLKDDTPFLCQEIKNDFHVVTKIVCAFDQKPSANIKDLQNSFFKVRNQIKKETFFLVVTPFKKFKLYPMVFDMTKDDTVYQSNVKLAKHWMIVGYKKDLPYIKKETPVHTSINFPFHLASDKLPYVGSLDIKGNPVHIKRVGDVTEYLKIKKLYAAKKYEQCLELIEEIMQDYPNSLFNAELLYYKIRVYAKIDDNDNVIAKSKIFLREHSADENVPEILALLARAYSKIGLSTDADYFFDRLFSEHEATESAKWGYIYMGEMLEESGAASRAVKFYKRALNETAEIEIAVTAAYHLAKYYVLNGKMKEATAYVMKIVNAKPDFFIHDLEDSMEMMYKFADNTVYISAAEIAKAILDATNKDHDEYERLLKDKGIWLSKSEDKKRALSALNDYIKAFPNGDFEESVSIAKDELFFDVSDGNFSVKLNEYNTLIDTYPNDSIGNRAIYEKAKLLLDNGMFSDVLGIEESILDLDADIYTDTNLIITDSAIGVMKLALENRECKEVLSVSNDYNITLSNEWDDGVYECSMMGGDHILAKEIASRNLSSKDMDLRKKWLYRLIKVDFATGNYSEVVEAAKELIILIDDNKESIYNEVYRILFDSYERLEKEEELLPSIIKIQELYGNNYKDMERYVSVMSMGDKTKDDNIVIKYGEEAMKIQNTSKSYAQSPYVEFTLFQSYINIEQLEKALDTIKFLDRVELKKETRARQKYLLGTVLAKLWRGEEAQIAYTKAIEADKDSAWAKLAASAKEEF